MLLPIQSILDEVVITHAHRTSRLNNLLRHLESTRRDGLEPRWSIAWRNCKYKYEFYFNNASILADRIWSHIAYPAIFKWTLSARCSLRSMLAGIGSQNTLCVPSFSFSFLLISTRSALLLATFPGCMSRRWKIPQTRILVSSLDLEKMACSKDTA